MKVNFYLSLITLCLFSIFDVNGQCNVNDYQALRGLYISTNGPGWDNAADWQAVDWSNPTTPPPGCDLCSLNGITCDAGRVTQIHLSNTMPAPPVTNLSGSLPTQIGLLTELTQFNIGNSNQATNTWPKNNVSGSIPTQFEFCTQLQQLILNGNDLTGSIPNEIYSLTALQLLNLSGNNLTGGLSPSIGNLINLQNLSLGYNTSFGGGIPSTIGSLSSLKFLNLELCGLTSGPIPSQIGNCTELQQLIVRNNPDLDGPIPSSISTIPTLEVFWGNNCGFTGSVPTFSGCPLLQRIHLSQNDFSGQTLPTSWGSLSDLTYIGAAFCNLIGSIPTSYGGLTNLDYFAVPNNALNGSLPAGLSNSAGMRIFNVENNASLSGTLPPSYGSWSQLIQFRASGCNFIGSVPPSYSNWSNCVYFEIGGNALGGDVPNIFGDMSNLFSVRLDSNSFTGSMPASLVGADSLKNLYVQECGLTGCFDDTLTYLCSTLENYSIDAGNNFDALWSNFCSSGAGACITIDPTSCTFPNGLPTRLDVDGNACIHGMINASEAIHLTPQTEAPSSPEAGTMYFDANTAKLRIWDGAQWRECW